MSYPIPSISKQFFCIVNEKQAELAAVISSYLAQRNVYVPFFQFPSVTAPKADDDEEIEIHGISRRRGNDFNVLVGNSIRRNYGVENLIIAGLSNDQKSYLTFLGDYNVIDISGIDDVDFNLGVFNAVNDSYISCEKETIFEGLVLASTTNSKLRIDNNRNFEFGSTLNGGGLIVIESRLSVSTVIAINYAVSINAAIRFVEPLIEKEEEEIRLLIEDWQGGNFASYDNISAKVFQRVGDINFEEYKFATFFTEGLPYSLILTNAIPFSYVHITLRPDFFIFNNIYFENSKANVCAVVFSPQFFKDEETGFVVDSLKANNYYVRELIGKSASVYNIGMHIREFPFDLLHICSHGGEVDGHYLTYEFVDSFGEKHVVECDEIVSFSPSEFEELIGVQTKVFWKKMDGLIWKSPELRAKGYHQQVYVDMQKALKDLTHENSKRVLKKNIANSNSLKCSDFIYQGMSNGLSPYKSAIVFNNSCWSWSGISEDFLYGGVRGYIGTLWKIDNNVAVETSKGFYSNMFNLPICHALHNAAKCAHGTKSEYIYIYWGLHFTSQKVGISKLESRDRLFAQIFRSLTTWKDALKAPVSDHFKKSVEAILRWYSQQIKQYFMLDLLKINLIFGKRKH